MGALRGIVLVLMNIYQNGCECEFWGLRDQHLLLSSTTSSVTLGKFLNLSERK